MSGVGAVRGTGAGLFGSRVEEGPEAEGLTEAEAEEDDANGARYACQDASIVADWSPVNWFMQLSGVYPCAHVAHDEAVFIKPRGGGPSCVGRSEQGSVSENNSCIRVRVEFRSHYSLSKGSFDSATSSLGETQ